MHASSNVLSAPEAEFSAALESFPMFSRYSYWWCYRRCPGTHPTENLEVPGKTQMEVL